MIRATGTLQTKARGHTLRALACRLTLSDGSDTSDGVNLQTLVVGVKAGKAALFPL